MGFIYSNFMNSCAHEGKMPWNVAVHGTTSSKPRSHYNERNICPPNMKIQNIKMREIHSIISGSFHFMFSHFFLLVVHHSTLHSLNFHLNIQFRMAYEMEWNDAIAVVLYMAKNNTILYVYIVDHNYTWSKQIRTEMKTNWTLCEKVL